MVALSFLKRLMCPAQDHFIFLILLIISDFCPLLDPDVILLSIWSVRPQVCSVLVWSVSNAPGGTDHGRGINDSPSAHAKLADIQKAIDHNAWSHILIVQAITGFDTIPAPYNIGKKICLFWKTRQRWDWITTKVIQQKDASHNEVASLIR